MRDKGHTQEQIVDRISHPNVHAYNAVLCAIMEEIKPVEELKDQVETLKASITTWGQEYGEKQWMAINNVIPHCKIT
eukprot:4928595-Karenia_brevis.AAC.1